MFSMCMIPVSWEGRLLLTTKIFVYLSICRKVAILRRIPILDTSHILSLIENHEIYASKDPAVRDFYYTIFEFAFSKPQNDFRHFRYANFSIWLFEMRGMSLEHS